MLIEDLGLLAYRDAWARQERAHEEVLSGGEERIFFVEHPPVITFGRRPGLERHLLATPEQLIARGVEVVPSDRGGDITFHGPGQLVAYPIIRLADHRFSVGSYVHMLERALISALAELGIPAHADPAAVGVWTQDHGADAKIAAIGVRIRRGVTLHGLALNVEPDLSFFNLIIPCGLPGRPVTSIRKLLGESDDTMIHAKRALGRHLLAALDK
ncbi:MAG TPA: lipoyl(octanoyl) transferase LipB [Tepidisphaeraceae bacterium]|nr:lipoyl(octanoyl) transferase LipB [Tepidisphaeraceae bacterium]